MYLKATLIAFTSLLSTATLADHDCRDVLVDEYRVYFGWASCYVSDSECQNHWVSDYISASISRVATLRPSYFEGCSPFASCTDVLTSYRTEEVYEEECEPHPDPEGNVVAVADIRDDNMITYGDCSWSGWSGYTHSYVNRLSCNGEQVGTVTELVGSNVSGCSANITADGYFRKYPNQTSSCRITILKEE